MLLDDCHGAIFLTDVRDGLVAGVAEIACSAVAVVIDIDDRGGPTAWNLIRALQMQRGVVQKTLWLNFPMRGLQKDLRKLPACRWLTGRIIKAFR